MKSKKLTFLESLMLVAGAGIGTGILTIPYAASKIGLFGTVAALLAAYAVSLVTYLFIADLTLHSKDSTQLLGILKQHLFRGKYGKVLSGIFFAVFVVILLQNLIVYIMTATDILNQLFGLPPAVGKIVFYLLASTVLIFGIKGIGVGEKFAVPLIGSVILLLMVLSFVNPQNIVPLSFGEPSLVLAVFGLFMFAFSAIFSVVQVTNNIKDTKDVKKVLVGGLTLNAVLTLMFAVAAVVGSERVTEVATVGLTDTIGLPWVKVFCAVFVLLAMFTSYWSSGLAFSDVLKEEFKINKRLAWLISTLPTVILALVLPLSVIDFVQIGAGALSVIVGIIILPAYYNAVKNAQDNLLLGSMAKSKVLVFSVAVFTLIMAVASLIPIK